MGVLSENSTGQGLLTNILKSHAGKLSFLSYIGGIIWFGLLAWGPNNNKTYFSENALLPALNRREYQYANLASQYYGVLKEESRKEPGIPYPYVQAQFRQLGLDVYLHNFTLNYPFGSKTKHEGKNLYAILRAPRAAGLEALVLSTPFRDENNIHGSTLPSIGLMLSLAKFFRQQVYLAKDIIFLIADHELVGFQAWLEAYHSVQTLAVLDSGFLLGRSGAIQAAINLELPADRLSHIDISIEGLNGQLPNLDLFNLVVELCPRESVIATFHNVPDPFETETWEGYQGALKTMLSMMVAQGTGAPSGAHGLFHRYAIQALTLRGHKKGFDVDKANFNQIGRVVEGIFRSLNNLLERFHQSFFFYLLPACRRYISIGLYMPPFALIVAPALFQALSIYLSLDDNITINQKKSKSNSGSLWSALPMVVTSFLLGYGMLRLPEALDMIGPQYGLTFKDSLYYGLIAFMLVIQFLPMIFIMRRKLKLRERQCYKCVALLALGAVLFTLALINISTATFIAVVYIPIAVLTSSFKYRILRFIQTILLFLIQPLAVTYIVILITHLLDNAPFPEEKTNPRIRDYLETALRGHKNLVLWNLEDWHLYQSYNFIGVSTVMTPVWLLFWYLPSA